MPLSGRARRSRPPSRRSLLTHMFNLRLCAPQGEAVKAAKAAAAAAKEDKSLAAASKEAVAALLKLKEELAGAEEA